MADKSLLMLICILSVLCLGNGKKSTETTEDVDNGSDESTAITGTTTPTTTPTDTPQTPPTGPSALTTNVFTSSPTPSYEYNSLEEQRDDEDDDSFKHLTVILAVLLAVVIIVSVSVVVFVVCRTKHRNKMELPDDPVLNDPHYHDFAGPRGSIELHRGASITSGSYASIRESAMVRSVTGAALRAGAAREPGLPAPRIKHDSGPTYYEIKDDDIRPVPESADNPQAPNEISRVRNVPAAGYLNVVPRDSNIVGSDNSKPSDISRGRNVPASGYLNVIPRDSSVDNGYSKPTTGATPTPAVPEHYTGLNNTVHGQYVDLEIRRIGPQKPKLESKPSELSHVSMVDNDAYEGRGDEPAKAKLESKPSELSHVSMVDNDAYEGRGNELAKPKLEGKQSERSHVSMVDNEAYERSNNDPPKAKLEPKQSELSEVSMVDNDAYERADKGDAVQGSKGFLKDAGRKASEVFMVDNEAYVSDEDEVAKTSNHQHNTRAPTLQQSTPLKGISNDGNKAKLAGIKDHDDSELSDFVMEENDLYSSLDSNISKNSNSRTSMDVSSSSENVHATKSSMTDDRSYEQDPRSRTRRRNDGYEEVHLPDDSTQAMPDDSTQATPDVSSTRAAPGVPTTEAIYSKPIKKSEIQLVDEGDGLVITESSHL